jgi:hypothetical protein
MQAARLRRLQLRELTDRLIVEYAGALPPGQILAAVLRAQRLMARGDRRWSPERIALCETFARQQLSLRVSRPVPSSTGV